MKNQPQFLSADDVASRLDRSVRFVYNLLRCGRLHSHRIGGNWAITEEQYDEYVKSCEVT